MAVIYETTLVPSKHELLTIWLPSQPWYVGSAPELSRAGGFRLDDPEGEVGIEFVAVNDASGPQPATYNVPLTYRGAPLAGAQGLVGTTEHGVLGTRWVYDAAHDPVFVTQLLALLEGKAEPQAQSKTDTADPTVRSWLNVPGRFAVQPITVAESGTDGTDIVGVSFDNEESSQPVALHLVRALQAEPNGPNIGSLPIAGVIAGWKAADGAARQGQFVNAREAQLRVG